jgi:hypothetical protein
MAHKHLLQPKKITMFCILHFLPALMIVFFSYDDNRYPDRNIFNPYMEFNFIRYQFIYLIDRTDLRRISNLVSGGEAVVTDAYSSLKR